MKEIYKPKENTSDNNTLEIIIDKLIETNLSEDKIEEEGEEDSPTPEEQQILNEWAAIPDPLKREDNLPKLKLKNFKEQYEKTLISSIVPVKDEKEEEEEPSTQEDSDELNFEEIMGSPKPSNSINKEYTLFGESFNWLASSTSSTPSTTDAVNPADENDSLFTCQYIKQFEGEEFIQAVGKIEQGDSNH